MGAFVPLTFAMGINDKGVESGLDRTFKTLKSINAVMDESGKLAGNIGKPFRGLGKIMAAPFQALGGALGAAERRIAQFNLASIAEDIKGLSHQTGTLSDEMDAAFASNAKAVKPMLAMIGKSGAELKKLTSQAAGMAYGMNVSADAVGKVMVELESAGGPAKAGLNALNMSTKEFVKLAEVTGLEVKDLSESMGDLQTSWGFSAQGAAKTANEMLAYGQAVGIGAEGLKQLKPLMDKMNTAMAGLPPNLQLNAQEMQSMATSTVKLAGAYREMGASSEEAMQFSSGTAEMFVKEYAAFQKAQLGLGEYGDVTKSLMSTLGSMGLSWEDFGALLKAGAVDSTQGMLQLQQTVQGLASKNGIAGASTMLGDLLGKVGDTSPAMAWLAQNVGKGEEALKRFSAMSVDSTGAIKKLANEGFSAGFTLQETFDRARQGMEHMVRAISNKETVNYVQMQVKAYRETGKEIQGLGKSKTWGPLIGKLSLLKRAGLQGVVMSMFGSKKEKLEVGKTFAKMELLGGAIEDISKAASPLMTTLGKFGPLGTMAGGLATWFSIPKEARDKLLADMKPAFDEIKKGVWAAWGSIRDATKKELPGIKEDLKILWKDSIVPFLKENAPKVGLAILDGLEWAWNKIGEEFGTGGKLAIGAAILGAAGGTGLLGAAMSFTSTIASAFGSTGVVGVAAIGLFASQIALLKLAMDDLEKTKQKTTSMISGYGTERFKMNVKERSGMVAGLTSQEIAALVKKGILSEDKLSAFDTDTDLNAPIRSLQRWGAGTAQEGYIQQQKAEGLSATEAVNRYQEFMRKVDMIKALPEIQTQLSEIINMADIAKKGQAIVAFEKSFITGQNFNETLSYLENFKKQQENVSQAMNLVESDLFSGGTALDNPDLIIAASKKLQENLAGVITASALPQVSKTLGLQTMTSLSEGIYDNEQSVMTAIDDPLKYIQSVTETNSPPVAGPLSEANGNPLYNGGYGMMELLSLGITDGAYQVQEAMTQALLTSFAAAMGVYEDTAYQRISASDVMARISNQLIQTLGGTVTLQADETRILKTSIDVPGMAGVTAAIIYDGALTRKVLTRIADATEGMHKMMRPGGEGARVILAS